MTEKNKHRKYTRNRSSIQYRTDETIKLYAKRLSLLNKTQNKNHQSYKNFGAKGIKVCDRWSNPIDGLENFYEDLLEPFIESLKIGASILLLIDPTKDFSPDNVQFVTHQGMQNYMTSKGLRTREKKQYEKIFCKTCKKEIKKADDVSIKRYSKKQFCSVACRSNKPFVIPEGREGMFKKRMTTHNNEVYYVHDNLVSRNKSIEEFKEALRSIIDEDDVPADVLLKTKEVLKEFS